MKDGNKTSHPKQSKRRVLVTGATGFLGTALTAQLKARGDDVVALGSKDCDLTKPGSLAAFEGPKYDQIYHLAVWTQAGDFCLAHPGEQWLINQYINTNMLSWWHTKQPQAKLVTMGTSCAFSPHCELTEDNYLEGQPIESLQSYGMTKRMLYAGLLALHKQYGHKYLCLIPSTLYGPGYHTDGRQMHFIFDVIRKILRGKMYGEQVVLWGDGHQSRELVYIDDFVRIALDLAENVDNELVNVGAGEEFTIRHFAQLVCKEVGYDFKKIHFDTSRYVGARSKCLSVVKLHRLLPSLRLTSLEEGLKHSVACLAKHEAEHRAAA
ncbi:MAG TPA: NAD-dependent epimerase/dehydratase family protein [Pirellulales bacterium]|nr:NAD-dependent epimerase/dehydratase family protein [Pirellulales bacterium]